jgi:hypothetical protein
MTPITTQFTLNISKELQDALQQKKVSSTAKKIIEGVQKLNAKIRPLHPGIDDPALSRYFIVELPRGANANQEIPKLNKLPGITAAYAKPQDHLA